MISFSLKLFSDIWLLNLRTMTWSEIKVNHGELEAPQLWCHPAIKVLDRLVVFSSSSNPTETDDSRVNQDALSLQTYILDCSQLMTQGCCTWQQRRDSSRILAATSLHSVVRGRGEFFIFGGRTNLCDGAWKVVNTLVRVTQHI